jgi:DNA polymerase III subunit delta'
VSTRTGMVDSTDYHPVLAGIVGQPRARAMLSSFVDSPVHAYLFVGPAGSGKRVAARVFCAALVCPNGGCGTCTSCKAVLTGQHPDVVVVERQGASISVEEARDIVQLAQLTPRVAERQVIVLTEFHLVDEAGPALLKTIEEPPDTTVLIVLADVRTRSLETIASRCVEVEFVPIDADAIAAALREEGVVRDVALAAATGARGNLDRARLLAADPGFVEREARWRSIPDRLDGTGAAIARLADEIVEAGESLVEVLRAQQEAELEVADKLAKDAGLKRTPSRKAIEDRHRRELRRLRTDELRAGLALLAATFRARLGSERAAASRVVQLVAINREIESASSRLRLNVNERLLLEALFLKIEQTD